MTHLNVEPIRVELSNLKEHLKTTTRRHKLPKDKRDELMRHFVDLIRENNELRKEVEAALAGHMQDSVMAEFFENTLMAEEVFSAPTKEIQLFIETRGAMSVTVPKVHSHIENPYGNDNGDVVYSYLASNGEIDDTLVTIESSTKRLFRPAEIERSCQLVADEIEKTRHRVNGLEYLAIPQLEKTIHCIGLKLEETERTNLVRIMKVR